MIAYVLLIKLMTKTLNKPDGYDDKAELCSCSAQ